MGTDYFYIIPLEYVYGSIDTKGWVKDYWRKALHTAGINFDIGDNSLYLINGESTRFFHYFLNGVCRHEHSSINYTSFYVFLNGVCRHEH